MIHDIDMIIGLVDSYASLVSYGTFLPEYHSATPSGINAARQRRNTTFTKLDSLRSNCRVLRHYFNGPQCKTGAPARESLLVGPLCEASQNLQFSRDSRIQNNTLEVCPLHAIRGRPP
jgi:hypothetical protein